MCYKIYKVHVAGFISKYPKKFIVKFIYFFKVGRFGILFFLYRR